MYRDFRKSPTTFARKSISRTRSTAAPSRPSARKSYSDYDDLDEISAPKFEPPPAAEPERSEAG
jgi:hypothetical protein